MIERRDQIEPNLYVSRWLRESTIQAGGCRDRWMLVGRRQEEERKRGEDDDERGVCWLRLLSLVACCRAVLSVVWGWGWGRNRGGGDGSISECAMGRGMGMCFEGRRRRGNGNRARTTMNRTELWRQSINQTDGIHGQPSPRSRPLSATIRIRNSPRKPRHPCLT